MTTTEAPAATPTFAGHTAEEWRAQARANHARRDESYDRCETDGFLTQWAAQEMAQRCEWLAKVAEANGMARRAVPVDPETREIIPGRWAETQYGRAYRTEDGRWLRQSMAENPAMWRAAHARKGFTLAWVLVPQRLDRRTFETYDDRNQSGWVVLPEDFPHWTE